MPEHWYAMTTRPQKERAACEVAMRYGLTPYVPMRQQMALVSPHSKRREQRQFPIVARLVFVAFDAPVEADDVYRLVHPGSKVESPFTGILGNGDVPAEIPLEQIERMVAANADAEALAVARKRGDVPRFNLRDRVQATTGPLTGFEGLVEEAGPNRTKALMRMLGGDVLVEFANVDLVLAAE